MTSPVVEVIDGEAFYVTEKPWKEAVQTARRLGLGQFPKRGWIAFTSTCDVIAWNRDNKCLFLALLEEHLP